MHTHIDPSLQAKERAILSWEAPVRAPVERSERWYAIGGAMVLGAAVYGILWDSWTVSVVVVLCGAVYFLLRGHKPPNVNAIVSRDGIRKGEEFLPWSQCAGFWILQTPLWNELRVCPAGKGKRPLTLQMTDISPTVVRHAVSRFLPEQSDTHESLLDIITRICKL